MKGTLHEVIKTDLDVNFEIVDKKILASNHEISIISIEGHGLYRVRKLMPKETITLFKNSNLLIGRRNTYVILDKLK